MLTVAETDENKAWQQVVGDIQLAINTTPHRVTKSSPMELMFGRLSRPQGLILAEGENQPEIDLQQLRSQAHAAIQNSASYNKALFDKGKAPVKNFNLGDLVLLKNEERNQCKLDPKYKGPFKITQVLENDRYLITSVDGKRSYKYPHERIRPAPKFSELNPSVILSDSETDGEIVE